jgi:ankyrin repeat protein
MTHLHKTLFILALMVPLAGCNLVQLFRIERLHTAAGRGNTDAVRAALERGVPIDGLDSEGNTPLHAAAAAGHLAVVRLLLERGATMPWASRRCTGRQ